MLKNFICPDGQRILVSDCLKEGGCRCGTRCATRSYLQFVAKERPWTGKPSTTQLIQGTMCAFLKLTKEFSISPDSRAFAVHGTKSHANLEAAGDEYSFLEEKFDGDGTDETGIADVIEVECGKTAMVDHKTSGSFKIAKALGFTTIEKPTGELYKSGKKKGQPKMEKLLIRDETAIDRWEWELQLSKYAIEAAKRGFNPDELRIEAIVRDGGTYIARSRGVFRNIYYFKINRLPDDFVLAYFKRKREALAQALEKSCWDEICDTKENWDGIKCSRYCEVAEFCKYGKYLKEEREVSDMPIKGLSEIRRFPRLGKIRLGIKKKTTSGTEYPAEINYFLLDPNTPSKEENESLIAAFKKLYGDEPKQIKIFFPVADPTVYFQQFYKRYGSSTSLKCKGDGTEAQCGSDEFAKGLKILRKNEMGWPVVECAGKECPYYKAKECTECGVLSVLLPELPGAGVWQIVTGSFNSIVNINSCIDYIRSVCGRAHMIPLVLERREQIIIHDNKKTKHFILHLNMDFKLNELQRLAHVDPQQSAMALPEPDVQVEDILFGENEVVDPIAPETQPKPEVQPETLPPPPPAAQETPKPAQAVKKDRKQKQAPETITPPTQTTPPPASASGPAVNQQPPTANSAQKPNTPLDALKLKADSIWTIFKTTAAKTPLNQQNYKDCFLSMLSGLLKKTVRGSADLAETEFDSIIDMMQKDPKHCDKFISSFLDSVK